jgi:hypothetical protein
MDLETRVILEDEARVVVADSVVLYLIGELVASRAAEICRPMGGILKKLGCHRTTASPAVGQLVSLLR